MAFYSTLYKHQVAERHLQSFTDNQVHKYAAYRNFDYGHDEKNVVSGLSPNQNFCKQRIYKLDYL